MRFAKGKIVQSDCENPAYIHRSRLVKNDDTAVEVFEVIFQHDPSKKSIYAYVQQEDFFDAYLVSGDFEAPENVRLVK